MAEADQVLLDWGASEETDITHYLIFRSEDPIDGTYTTVLDSVEFGTETFIDVTATVGTRHYYRLKSLNTALLESINFSNEVCATPGDTEAPAIPIGLAGEPRDVQIALVWAENQECDLVSYELSRGLYADMLAVIDTILTTHSDSLRYTDSDLINFTDYYYSLRAIDNAGLAGDSCTTIGPLTPLGASADLALTMSVDNTQPDLNEQIEFILRVTNLGPDTAVNVVATDTIPDGLTFDSWGASTGIYDDLSGQWLIGEMTADQEDSLTIICTVSSFGQVVNSAWVEDEQEGGSTDVDPDNNTAEVTIEGHACDIALSMSLDNETPNVGDEVQITIRLTNYGPDTATGVEVIAQRPTGLTYTDVDFTVGTYVGGIWRIGSQTVGELDSLVITARVDLPTPIVNFATAVHSDPPDVLLNNNEAAVVIHGQLAELAISQTTDNYGPEVGEVVHFEVLVTNNGPSDATGIVVFDDIPIEFTVTEAVPSSGEYADSTWTIGDIAYQATDTLRVTATVNTGGTIVNTAYIAASDQSDSNPNNDISFITWSTDPTDLKLTMLVDETSANVGDSLTFNVILENLGDNPGSGIQVMDKVPPGLGFLSAEVTQGTYDPGSGLWDVSELMLDQVVVLTLIVRVDLATTITNTASITRAWQADEVPGNNSDSIDVTGREADLYITKTVDNAWPEVGDQITYIIQITNPGPSDVNYVSVLDTLPVVGLTYISITTDDPTHTFNDITGVWEIGAMPIGESHTLTVVAEVTEIMTIRNTAWIDSIDVPDPDPENNKATVLIRPAFSDLQLAVHASDTQPELGSEFDYIIGLRNLGPDLASEIVVKDLLPEQVSWVDDAHSTSTGNYDPVTGIWDVGEVASQDSVWLTITVGTNQAGVISNAAYVLNLLQSDSDWHNNNDHVDVACVDVPPEIRIIEPPVATIAEALAVQAVVTDNTGVAGATLHYRQGNATEFNATPMIAEDDSTYVGTIPADAVTVTGLSCYVSAEDIQGNIGQSSLAAVSVAVPELAKASPQPAGSDANAYRLFSVPLNLTDTDAALVFEDDLGTYDKEKWRLFGLNAAQSFMEFPECGPVVAGAGFFLIVKDAGIYIDVGAGETVPMDQPFGINLHAGWNMVGNPFNIPISLDMLSLESSDPLNIQNYLGSWAEVVGTIQPFEGYLVSADESDRLLVDPALVSGAPRTPAGPEPLWSVRIEARAGEALDSQNFAEVHENAKVDWDNLDRPEPPVIGDYVSVYFPHPEWETPFAAFTKDSRPVPSESGGQHWDFKVRGNVSGSISLGFEELASVPEAYEIWVRDELLCVNRDLRENSSYAYTYGGSGEPRAFRLVVGGAAYVAANLAAGETVPGVVTLGANFPNPFNPTTAIRFSLPQRETVDLRIYDVTGRLVRNLIAGEQLDRGYHLEMWNGANDSGRRVASGVYFSRLTAGKEVRTQKMVLMK